LLFLDDGTNFYRSFSLLLALQYLQQKKIVPKPAVENSDWLQLGKTVIHPFEAHDGGYVEADAQGYQYLLALERGKNVFPTISFGDILEGKFNPELLQDHIVLVGVIAQGVKDDFYTSQCGTLTVCPPIPGLELHGYMVHQLLRLAKGEGQAPIATFPDSLETAWIGLWVLGGGFIGVWVRGAWRFSLAVLMGMLLLSGVVVSGMMYGAWIPFIPPVIGLVVNAMVVTAWLSNREKQDRTLLMSLFSRHVSSEVAQAVWEKREQFLEKGRLRPQKVVVTTLFTDLEGFTTVAENMEPDTVLDWLNTYMERTVKIITNHGGMVDDYHGDMIKADFGVFRLEQTEANKRQDANNAVSCAVALEQEMRHLNTQWQQQGLPEVRMRIGMQTGSVVVGSLGSEQRLKFTTIGDSVNVASRLESFHKDSLETWSKDEVCRILIGETTKQYLGDHPWRLKEVGVITLRGKANRISVYRLFTNPGSPESRSVIPIEQARG
ncbi:MAG: adenylate/guanylate cyclase domain-containing protein, partial [Nitrospirales bacterium]